MSRTPPHNLEAEQSTLGAVLLDGEAYETVRGILPAPDRFYSPKHAIIYAAIISLRERGEPTDLVMLTEELRRTGKLDEAGGSMYLIALADGTPTAAYAENYARTVASKWRRREMIAAAGEIHRLAYDEGVELDNALELGQAAMSKVASGGSARDTWRDMGSITTDMFDHVNRLFSGEAEQQGIPTGLKALDDMLGGGRHRGNLDIIAARPSMGKTAFMLTGAIAAAKRDYRVGIFSLEMSDVSLAMRILANEARVDMQRMRTPRGMTDRDLQRACDTAGKMAEWPIHIDDTPGLSVLELKSRARRLKQRRGLDILFVDYMQLASGTGHNRQEQVANISRELKSLARELDINVTTLSQLSRSVEARPDKRPILSDLRESGGIEQDADVAMMLYRDDYYDRNSEKQGIVEIIVRKQRNGPVGTVEAMWHSQYVAFRELAPELHGQPA